MPPIDDKKIGFRIPIPIPAGPSWTLSGGQNLMAELIYQPEIKINVKKEMDKAIEELTSLGYPVKYLVIDYDRWKTLLVSGDGKYNWVDKYNEIPLVVLGEPVKEPLAIPDVRSMFYVIERLRMFAVLEDRNE